MNRRRYGRAGAASLLLVGVLVLVPDVAGAHDVTGSRFDAPLPLGLLLAGAGGTVALTALWLAFAGRSGTTAGGRTLLTVDERTVRWIRTGAGAAFFLAVLAALAAGSLGRQVAAENVATVFTWPVWFRGVGLLAIAIGSPWRALSPWRRAYRWLCRLEGGQLAVLDEYPPWPGAWPALVGFLLLFGVVENLTVVPRSPALTAGVVAVYALAMLAGGVLFGPVWFERADPLGVLYRLFGRVAWISTERSPDGSVEISVRPPWQGCTSPVSGPAIVAFVVAAVYTVSFDGFTDTQLYGTLLFDARAALGTGPSTSVLLYIVGLLLYVGAFVLTVTVGDVLGASAGTGREGTSDGGRPSWRASALAFAPTVVPIAAAYDVAHNYPYVVRSTARLVEITTGAGPFDPLGWLSLPAYWGSQVFLIVAGHVVAVVAAHHVAVDRYPSLSASRRAHLPLVVLMVGYTVLSLWIVSRPVIGG